VTPTRRGLLAKIHIAKAQMGLGDTEYRLMLRRITGHVSAGDCTDIHLDAVIREFIAKGWKAPARKRGPASRHKPDIEKGQADKVRALWIDMAKEGIVKNASETALNAYVKRLCGVDNVAWLPVKKGSFVIEALKAWAARERLRAVWAMLEIAGLVTPGANSLIAYVRNTLDLHNRGIINDRARIRVPKTMSAISAAAADLCIAQLAKTHGQGGGAA